ncbi:leucine-rich repeat protein [Lachnospiraceae bacterium ZAX-1]
MKKRKISITPKSKSPTGIFLKGINIFLSLCIVLAGATAFGITAKAADDYPAKWKNVAMDSTLDDWRMYNRECTSFVAWCLSSRNGYTIITGKDWSAGKWKANAQAAGIAVNSTPAVGAVAWSSGHVAWVSAVNGDSVTIEEYNHSYTGTYNSRTISRLTKEYIHFKDMASTPAIPADTTVPVISNVEISDVSTFGYTVTCTVTDNVGVDRVQFPTWTLSRDQDDLQANWQTSSAVSGSRSGNTFTYRVNDSDHNYEKGFYVTHIYAYDSAGNATCYQMPVQNVENDFKPAKITTYNGHIYKLFNDNLTWDKAKEISEQLGGHLATITSVEEQVAVSALLKAEQREYYWIGASDAESEGKWVWVTGETFSYTNWEPGQPNDWNGAQDYANILSSRATWGDAGDETTGLGFICEFETIDVGRDFKPAEITTYNGHTYKLYNDILNWDKAKEISEQLGGHLATITSEEEQVAVSALLKAEQREYYWLGASDAESEGKWVWVTGETFSYTNWEPGQPNDWNGAQDYANILSSRATWGDAGDETTGIGFVCEFEYDTQVDDEVVDISKCTVTLVTASYDYDENEKKPFVTVQDQNTALKNGMDYTLSYANNINAGIATVAVAGIGDYTGRMEKTFVIDRADIAPFKVALDTTAYTYDGAAKQPSVTVQSGNTVLTNGSDYTVSYQNNVEVGLGTAAATVEGVGNYTGSVAKPFTIATVMAEWTDPEDSSNIYKYSRLDSIVVITGYKSLSGTVRIPSEINGYPVTSIGENAFYNSAALSSVAIPDSVTAIGDAAFAGCSNLTDINIGNGVISIGSYAFADCSSLTAIAIPDSVTAIGDAAFAGCRSLTDIDIPSSVTAIGGVAFARCGSLTSITIPDSVTAIGHQAFYGSGLQHIIFTGENPILSIDDVFNEKVEIYCPIGNASWDTLEADTQGLAEVLRFDPGQGVPMQITKCTISLAATAYDYSGTEKRPSVTVEDGSTALTEGTDYALSYRNNVDAGTAAIVIAGKENYIGSKFMTFVIAEADISQYNISLATTSYSYDGKAKQPTATVTNGGKTLTGGTDYTLSYKNNIEPGTAVAMVAGKGNYAGSATKTFTITKQSVQADDPNDTDGPTKPAQSFAAYTKNYNKVYGDKPFTLNAKRKTGNGKISYSTSNSKVAAVDAKGKVTLKGTGYATITVKAAATNKYSAASIKITVKIAPKKQPITSAKPTSGKKLTVKWKKNSQATGYEIQYSTSKNFKKNSTMTATVKRNGTTSTTIKKLTKGKKYYVRLRAYKAVKIDGKNIKIYAKWSPAKTTAKIK